MYLAYIVEEMKFALAHDLEPETRDCGSVRDAPKNIEFRNAVKAAMDRAQVDAFVYPTWSNQPRKIGDMESPAGDNSPHLSPHTGMPAITVPTDSIAVLPFVNASNDPEAEYLSDGISESVINNLASIQDLRVIPRSTAFRYKGKDVDALQLATDLKVSAVVSGRVLQRGELLNVQAELIDARTNAQIWGGRYERKRRIVVQSS